MRPLPWTAPLALWLGACQSTGARVDVVQDGQQPRAVVAAGGSQVAVMSSISGASGKTIRFGRNLFVNPDCSSRGVPDIQIRAEPMHGVVAVKQGGEFTNFGAPNPRTV